MRTEPPPSLKRILIQRIIHLARLAGPGTVLEAIAGEGPFPVVDEVQNPGPGPAQGSGGPVGKGLGVEIYALVLQLRLALRVLGQVEVQARDQVREGPLAQARELGKDTQAVVAHGRCCAKERAGVSRRFTT